MTETSAPRYSVIDKVGMPHVLAFIVKRLSIYNTGELDWLKLLPLTKKALLHGECMFPYTASNGEREHGFRIRASVNVNMSPPFQYEHWARIPSKTAARGWQSGEQVFHFADLEECAVHTLAHECFHFLSESKQVGEKNTEANANWWADGWLAAFRLKQGALAAQGSSDQQLANSSIEPGAGSARQATLVQPTLPNSSHQLELLDR